MMVLSLGAGVQSSALGLMAAAGDLPRMPDCAIFADTGDERRATYRHLDYLEARFPFPLIRVRRSEMSLSESTLAHFAGTGGFDQTPPFFFLGGMLPKHCSKEWKTRVVVKYVRETMLGLAPGQRAPAGTAVEMWIGISRDEIVRMKPNEVPWITNCWPLIDQNMRRGDCERWLIKAGHPIPPRSACIYCPFRAESELKDMRDRQNEDDDWARAVAFDEAARDGGNGTTGPLYVSVRRKPLREVDFGDQPALFDNDCEGNCGV